jgi:methyl-accepting chemotaxis protein
MTSTTLSQTSTESTKERLWQTTRNLMMAMGGAPSIIAIAATTVTMQDDLSDALMSEMLTLLVVILAIGVVMGWVVAKYLIFPILDGFQGDDGLHTTINHFINQVKAGDLNATLDVTSEQMAQNRSLGQMAMNLNALITQLRSVTQEVLTISDGVSEKARDILTATNEQIGTATEQDASVMQTTSTVQEVQATVTETAERAAAVAEMAQKSVDVSKSGQQAVTDAIDGMNLIRQRVESIADNILVLSEHTQQIGEIIATVSALADQSKLLALNASVEAARAGEEGKGFAVVAMEVRNLADQSREATAQVRDILSEIQQATNSAVMVTEEGTKGVDAGVVLVNRAGGSIRELSSTIEEAAYAAVQIAASTRQQTVGMDQLSKAMTNIRQSTSHTTTSTMDVERAARELNIMARKLGQLVEQFRIVAYETE